MKKSLFNKLNIIFIGTLVIVTLLVVILLFSEQLGLPLFLHNLLYEVTKTLIITGIIGFIAKALSEQIMKIKVNDEKMKQLGIHSIGEGRLDKKQTKVLFGSNTFYTSRYQKQLK